jgi:hypothetical protein
MLRLPHRLQENNKGCLLSARLQAKSASLRRGQFNGAGARAVACPYSCEISIIGCKKDKSGSKFGRPIAAGRHPSPKERSISWRGPAASHSKRACAGSPEGQTCARYGRIQSDILWNQRVGGDARN